MDLIDIEKLTFLPGTVSTVHADYDNLENKIIFFIHTIYSLLKINIKVVLLTNEKIPRIYLNKIILYIAIINSSRDISKNAIENFRSKYDMEKEVEKFINNEKNNFDNLFANELEKSKDFIFTKIAEKELVMYDLQIPLTLEDFEKVFYDLEPETFVIVDNYPLSLGVNLNDKFCTLENFVLAAVSKKIIILIGNNHPPEKYLARNIFEITKSNEISIIQKAKLKKFVDSPTDEDIRN